MPEPTALEAVRELETSPKPWYAYNVTLNNVRDALIRDGNNIVVARLNGDHFLNDAAYAALAVNSIDAAVAALEGYRYAVDRGDLYCRDGQEVTLMVVNEAGGAALDAIRKAAQGAK